MIDQSLFNRNLAGTGAPPRAPSANPTRKFIIRLYRVNTKNGADTL